MADRQRLAIAGLIVASPAFAFLNGATGALNPESTHAAYAALARTSITFITIDDRPVCRQFHGESLDLREDGTWLLGPIGEAAQDGHAIKAGRDEPAAS